MQSIGERLEEARKRRGVTIREAAEATKIRGDYLNSFESNNFDISIPEIYVRGFLRSYAGYLKISSEKIVTDYNAILLASGKSSKRESRELYGRVELAQASNLPADGDSIDSEDASPAEPKPSISDYLNNFKDKFANLDRELVVKVSAIAVASLLSIVLLIWLIKVLISSEPEATVTDSGAVVEQIAPDVQETITLIANGDLRVKVLQVEPRQVLYDGPLAEGEQKEINKTGRIVITYSEGKNLVIEKDGSKFGMPVEGKGRSPFQ
ncbi:helix-turn-helix domain-containing protein [Puniceicoccaceae bacterium K14]|nr:helix-turn-helix domain-containing protein [Puniceicoccaceae bacterium K14]